MHTILVADDSVTIQHAVEIAFAKEPFTVVKAGSGAEALVRARDSRASLVLADHQMPDQSGYDLAQALRADPATAQVPVLILTSSAAPYDEARGRAAGAVGNIQKPFDCQSLLDRVRALLGVAAGAAAPATLPTTSAAPISAAVAATPRPPGFGGPAMGGGLPRPPASSPGTGSFPRPAGAIPAAAPVAASPVGAASMGAAAPLARAPTPQPDKNVDPFGFGASMAGARPSAINPFANPPAAVPVTPPASSPSPFGASALGGAASPAPATPAVVKGEPSFDISFDDVPAQPPPTASAAPIASAVPTLSSVPASSPPRAAAFAEAEFLEVADVDIAEISSASLPPISLEPLPAAASVSPAPTPAAPAPAAPSPAAPAPAMARAPTPVASSMADLGRITNKVDLQNLAKLDADTAGVSARALELATTAVVERAAPAVAQASTTSQAAPPSREALSAEAREIIERIAWEVVPELAETIIREELQRLLKAR